VPQLSVDRRGAVAVCTIANPPHGYMDEATVAELDTATAELEQDDSVRAVVFTGGVPGVFIQHYSVHEIEAIARQLRDRGVTIDPGRPTPERRLDQVFKRVETMPKPVIAAINGNCMGGGFEFALCCDIRLAEDGPHSIGLPEVNVGILPGAGGTQKLGRLVGTARALEMILRGRTVSPREAAQLGMVHELCPAPVVNRALEIADELAGKSPRAVAHIKKLVRMAGAVPAEEGLALERTLFADLLVAGPALDLMAEMNRGERDIRSR
jgi:enoyl-CoA hydratase